MRFPIKGFPVEKQKCELPILGVEDGGICSSGFAWIGRRDSDLKALKYRCPLREERAPRNQTAQPGWERLAGKGANGGRFVVLHVKNGIQLRDLQQIVNLFGEVQQFQFAALVTDGGEGADQLADAGAVDIANIPQVQQNLLLSFAEQVFDGIAQNNAAFAESDSSTQVDDGDPDLPAACLLSCSRGSLLAVQIIALDPLDQNDFSAGIQFTEPNLIHECPH